MKKERFLFYEFFLLLCGEWPQLLTINHEFFPDGRCQLIKNMETVALTYLLQRLKRPAVCPTVPDSRDRLQ